MCLAVVRPNLKDKVNHLSEQCCRGETGSYRFLQTYKCTVYALWTVAGISIIVKRQVEKQRIYNPVQYLRPLTPL